MVPDKQWVSDEQWAELTDRRNRIPTAQIDEVTHICRDKKTTHCGLSVDKHSLLIFLQKPEVITCNQCKEALQTNEEWHQLEEFVMGKTIKAVENWDVGPTFMFTDGSSLELYTQKKGFAWVLEEGANQRSEAER
jgi:hypothetical protein